jgi:hypothetical protein
MSTTFTRYSKAYHMTHFKKTLIKRNYIETFSLSHSQNSIWCRKNYILVTVIIRRFFNNKKNCDNLLFAKSDALGHKLKSSRLKYFGCLYGETPNTHHLSSPRFFALGESLNTIEMKGVLTWSRQKKPRRWG